MSNELGVRIVLHFAVPSLVAEHPRQEEGLSCRLELEDRAHENMYREQTQTS